MICKKPKVPIRERKRYLTKVPPRYLQGAVAYNVWLDDILMYKRHRLNCYCATAIVNSYPSKMNPHNYVKTRRLADDASKLAEIDKKNKLLLKKINIINRSKGYVDTYNENAYLSSSRWPAHRSKMKTIEQKNARMYNRIVKAKPVYRTSRLERDWQQNVQIMTHMARFTLQMFLNKSVDEQVQEMPSISDGLVPPPSRPRCFMDFRVQGGIPLGRIVIELYSDYAPKTVNNFLAFCNSVSQYSYKGCKIFNVVKGRYLETGDVTHNNGKGGTSIYGQLFGEEDHSLRHTKPGVLSMVRIDKNYNNSQFSITFSPQKKLDGKRVVFGKTIKGVETLYKIQDLGKKVGSPIVPLYIDNCGQILSKKMFNRKKPR